MTDPRTYGTSRKHREYELQEYDPRWRDMFLKYAEQLRSIIGDNLVEVEHMGSTSIEGMVAKPQIDILVTVKDLDKIQDVYAAFETEGFVPRGREYVGIGDEYVTLDSLGGKRLASIHIFEQGHPQIAETKLFRDYLIAHEADKQLYIHTKKELYAKYRDNYEGYDVGKKDVIDEIKQRAREWAAENNRPST